MESYPEINRQRIPKFPDQKKLLQAEFNFGFNIASKKVYYTIMQRNKQLEALLFRHKKPDGSKTTLKDENKQKIRNLLKMIHYGANTIHVLTSDACNTVWSLPIARKRKERNQNRSHLPTHFQIKLSRNLP